MNFISFKHFLEFLQLTCKTFNTYNHVPIVTDWWDRDMSDATMALTW
jgi:hypothetical protein